MSKYREVANDLRLRINNNEFNKTKKLPSEDELIEVYQVSRNTIRSAIKHLAEYGFVYPIQGSGYYIHEIDEAATFLKGTNGLSYDYPGSSLTTKLISLELKEADEKMAELMKCDLGTPIYHILRIRYIDNHPFCVEYTYYNKNVIPYLGKEICEKSISKYIQEDLKLTYGLTDKIISSIALSKEDADYLNLNEGDPALVIEDRVHLSNGQRFNASSCVYHYKNAKFYTIVK